MDKKYDILRHPNVKLTTDGGTAPYKHGEDTRSIAAIRLDPALLKQAEKLEAAKHDFILLTEEDMEEITPSLLLFPQSLATLREPWRERSSEAFAGTARRY